MAAIAPDAVEGEDFVLEEAPTGDCSRIISVASEVKKKINFVAAKGVDTALVEEQVGEKADNVPDEPAPVAEADKAKAEPRGTVIKSQKDKFTIQRVLGRGGFGVVYKVKSKNTGQMYALKTEEKKTIDAYRRLKCEAWIMFCMSTRGSSYYLDLVDCGQTATYNFVVMPLIGRSLDVIKKSLIVNEQFSASTIVRLMIETLTAIEDMHDAGFLHRDVKPANFAVGLEDWSKIYILDFGISRHYRDADGSILRPRKTVPFIGTLRYAPRSCHDNTEYGRVGDLESWLFMSLEMWNPTFLPWTTEPDRAKFFVHKRHILSDANKYLRTNPAMPVQFCHLAMYVGSLNGLSAPDYTTMKTMLLSIPHTNKKINLSEDFDWTKKDVMIRAKKFAAEDRLKKKADGISCVTNAEEYFVYGV